MSIAIAHPNIALIKYWGKRDDRLMLPAAGSISLTLDVFPTTTSVTVDDALTADAVDFGDRPATAAEHHRVAAFLDLVRESTGSSGYARVSTRNSVPTGAGLASSASGFAALAVAAAAAYGLDLDTAALSRLARRGSGSACRSLIDDVAIWHAGIDDRTSFAESLPAPALGMVVVVIDAGAKKVSSRDAMRATRDASPYYDAWVHSTSEDVLMMQQALAADDFTTIGELTESNALRMHAAIEATRPPIRYLAPDSVRTFDLAAQLRDDDLPVYATADAGPNVVLLCREADVDTVRTAVIERGGFLPEQVIGARGGRGARLIVDGEGIA